MTNPKTHQMTIQEIPYEQMMTWMTPRAMLTNKAQVLRVNQAHGRRRVKYLAQLIHNMVAWRAAAV